MHRSKATIWLIALYLGFLVNLGPSMHHASCFGLHNHDSNGASVSEEGVFSCCCHHDSMPSDAIPSDRGTDNSVVSAEHDCAFCKFFDDYNIVLESFQMEVAQAEVYSIDFLSSDRPVSAAIISTARGPPSA